MTDKAQVSDIDSYEAFIVRGHGSGRHLGAYVVAKRMVHVTVWAGGAWHAKSSQVGSSPPRTIAHMIAGELARQHSFDLDDLAATLAEIENL